MKLKGNFISEPDQGQKGMLNPLMGHLQKPGQRQERLNSEDPSERSARSHTQLPGSRGLAASQIDYEQPSVPKFDKVPKMRSNSNERTDRMREEDVNVLYEQHEKLIENLLIEEDNIIDEHKGLIDNMINSIKNDSVLFQNLQAQGSIFLLQKSMSRTTWTN